MSGIFNDVNLLYKEDESNIQLKNYYRDTIFVEKITSNEYDYEFEISVKGNAEDESFGHQLFCLNFLGVRRLLSLNRNYHEEDNDGFLTDKENLELLYGIHKTNFLDTSLLNYPSTGDFIIVGAYDYIYVVDSRSFEYSHIGSVEQ